MLDAVALAASDQISVFDAAILCAASRAGCGQIFTEDLAEGPRYNGVTVVNPFR
jgi:predicted nucleic acid-binding protein